MAGERVNGLKERMGDEYDRVKERGLQGGITTGGIDSSTNRYSAAEVKAEMRDGRDGRTVNEGDNSMVNYYQGIQDDGGKFNNKAKAYLANLGVNFDAKEEAAPAPAPAAPPQATPGPVSGGGTTGGANSPVQSGTTSGNNSPVINQNTEGGSSVAVGGNNSGTIDNSVDNSRYYEGSDRTFNYTGGDGESSLYDTPVSKATMGGFYDVDDSPAASQSFLDRYITSNNDSQAESDAAYKKSGSFDYNAMADSSRAFNPQAMQERIDRSPLTARDRSKVQLGKLFGDMDNFDPGDFLMPKPPKPVVSNVGDIAGEYRSGM